jgi:hypothetical protein
MRQQFAERETNEKGMPLSIPFLSPRFEKAKSHHGGTEEAKAGKIRSSINQIWFCENLRFKLLHYLMT